MKFGFIAKHRGAGRRNGCARRSMSREVGFMHGRQGHAADASRATRISARRSVPAFLRATGPMTPGACGTTCLLTAYRAGRHVRHVRNLLS